MTGTPNLRQALLELGLEDLIPLPEAATAGRLPGVPEGTRVEDVANVLVDLLREKRIQVWAGHWSKEPEVTDRDAAEDLLRSAEQYDFNSPADLELRVYYVNVDNIEVPEPRS